jgi:hypothetical protein
MGIKETYQSFFQRVHEILRERRPQIPWKITHNANGRNWAVYDTIKYNIWYGAGFTQDKDLRVDLHIGVQTSEQSQKLFDRLLKRKETIESSLNFNLKWESPSQLGTENGRLAVYKTDCLDDISGSFEELASWAADKIISLWAVLTTVIEEMLDH